MLVSAHPKEGITLASLIARDGHQVVASLGEADDLAAGADVSAPDVIIVAAETPHRDLLTKIGNIRRKTPRPIVLFYEGGQAAEIAAAVGAGVSALMPGRATRERLGSAIDVAIAQFGETSRLVKERDRAATALAERKIIERAKGIIMKQRGLDEDAAYKFMRQAAMNKNLRLGQLAASIIEAEELLG